MSRPSAFFAEDAECARQMAAEAELRRLYVAATCAAPGCGAFGPWGLGRLRYCGPHRPAAAFADLVHRDAAEGLS